jgi:DNA-binding IclR family transcriptional regulator
VTDGSTRVDDGQAAKAASRTLDILEFVGGQTLSVPSRSIAAACGIPGSTLRGLLRMLQRRGYLAYRAAEKGWTPGMRLAEPWAGGLDFEQGMAVLEVFGTGGGGLSVDELASGSGLPRETVCRSLGVLAGYGMVVPALDGTYGPGRRLPGLSSRVGWAESLQSAARPVLTRLRDESGETASLFVEDAGQALYLDQVESHFDLRCRGWVGRRVRLEGTSVGAAFADPARAHTVADGVNLGVTAIACAIGGLVPSAGVNIIGPSWRLEERGLDGLAELVQTGAKDLAETLAAGRNPAS